MLENKNKFALEISWKYKNMRIQWVQVKFFLPDEDWGTIDAQDKDMVAKSSKVTIKINMAK